MKNFMFIIILVLIILLILSERLVNNRTSNYYLPEIGHTNSISTGRTCVYKIGDTYYLYLTKGRDIDLYHSSDGVTWTLQETDTTIFKITK